MSTAKQDLLRVFRPDGSFVDVEPLKMWQPFNPKCNCPECELDKAMYNGDFQKIDDLIINGTGDRNKTPVGIMSQFTKMEIPLTDEQRLSGMENELRNISESQYRRYVMGDWRY